MGGKTGRSSGSRGMAREWGELLGTGETGGQEMGYWETWPRAGGGCSGTGGAAVGTKGCWEGCCELGMMRGEGRYSRVTGG